MGGRLSTWIALVLAGAAAVAIQIQLPLRPPVSTDERVLPRPRFAHLASLGFDELLSDYYWLEAVQLVGKTEVNIPRYSKSIGRLIDLVTTLDPWVGHPYRFAAIWMTENVDSVRTANRLLVRGIVYHPDDWRDRFYLGFNQFFYLDEDAAAANSLEPASEMPGAPLYLGRLVARLRAQTGDLDVAQAFLEQLLRSAEGPKERKQYEQALDELHTERIARFLDAARRAYRKRNGHDIHSVEDLVRGPGAVLRALPPEPHGKRWVLNAKTGRIVSSYYGRRYVVHPDPAVQALGPKRHDGERTAKGEKR